MYLNIGFLKIEIIILLVSLIYTLYYFLGNIFSSFINLKSIVGRKKVVSADETPKELKIKTDENEHAENYTKDSLSYEDKLLISDLLKKARVYIGSGDYEKAKNYIVEGLSIDKFNTDLNLDLAKIYVNEKEFLKAEYIYKDLLLVHNDNVLIMKKLGDLLASQEKYDLSLEIYKKAYKVNKDDLEVVNMLANLSYATKDFIAAEIYLKEFLKEKPKDLENLLLLGNTYEKLEDYEDALESYKKALIMKPYENFEIKDKIHKLEIFLLQGDNEDKNKDFPHLQEEIEEYKEDELEKENISEIQEKLETEEILEEKFSGEIEAHEKNLKK